MAAGGSYSCSEVTGGSHMMIVPFEYIDYCGGHAGLHVIKLYRATCTNECMHNWRNLSAMDCTSVSFLVLILYYSCVRCNIVGSWEKVHRIFLYASLQTSTNL